MARKQSGMDALVLLPWPVGVVLAIVAFLAVRFGVGAYFSRAGGPVLQGIADAADGGAFEPIAWVLLAATP